MVTSNPHRSMSRVRSLAEEVEPADPSEVKRRRSVRYDDHAADVRPHSSFARVERSSCKSGLVAHGGNTMSPCELEEPIRRYVQGGRGCSPGHPFAPYGVEDEQDTRTFARSGISEGRGDLDGEFHGVRLQDLSVPRGTSGGDPAMIHVRE